MLVKSKVVVVREKIYEGESNVGYEEGKKRENRQRSCIAAAMRLHVVVADINKRSFAQCFAWESCRRSGELMRGTDAYTSERHKPAGKAPTSSVYRGTNVQEILKSFPF